MAKKKWFGLAAAMSAIGGLFLMKKKKATESPEKSEHGATDSSEEE